MKLIFAFRNLVDVPIKLNPYFVQNALTFSGPYPVSYYLLGAVVLPRGETGRCVNLTTRLHLKPKIRMNGAAPLLPLYAFMAWTRGKIYFTYLPFTPVLSNS